MVSRNIISSKNSGNSSFSSGIGINKGNDWYFKWYPNILVVYSYSRQVLWGSITDVKFLYWSVIKSYLPYTHKKIKWNSKGYTAIK